MLKNQEIATAINEVHSMRSDSSGKRILKLLDLLMNEIRIRNDTVAPEELLRNQGEIKAYQELASYIVNGLP